MLMNHQILPIRVNSHSINKLKSRWIETCTVILLHELHELRRLHYRGMAFDALSSNPNNNISNSPNRLNLKPARRLYHSSPRTNRSLNTSSSRPRNSSSSPQANQRISISTATPLRSNRRLLINNNTIIALRPLEDIKRSNPQP